MAIQFQASQKVSVREMLFQECYDTGDRPGCVTYNPPKPLEPYVREFTGTGTTEAEARRDLASLITGCGKRAPDYTASCTPQGDIVVKSVKIKEGVFSRVGRHFFNALISMGEAMTYAP